VADAMLEVLRNDFGNPSSIHWHGRRAKTIIEGARKKIAQHLGVTPGEIFFTSGGTEADNLALLGAVRDLGCTRIITSALEHHAVIHTAEYLQKQYGTIIEWVNHDELGRINYEHLDQLLAAAPGKNTLVSLMHANNEIGNMTSLSTVGKLCREHGAYFHSDTVQTIGHWPLFPKHNRIHFIAASAHKFNGPKGIGLLFIDNSVQVKPMLHGGAQERNMRGGTENVAGIVGMAKALEIAMAEMDTAKQHIISLRNHMIDRLVKELPGVMFIGDHLGKTNYIPLNVSLPKPVDGEMVLFNLDIAGVSASGGSACSSGSQVGSHVVKALGSLVKDRANVRFSFGASNTLEEIDFTVDTLAGLVAKAKA
jgi:cysteine desulfurase